MRNEVEDGMGFSGLVESPRERAESAYADTARKIAVAREKRLAEALQQIEGLKSVLKQAQEKLMIYRKAQGGEYLGGVELSELNRRIDAALK